MLNGFLKKQPNIENYTWQHTAATYCTAEVLIMRFIENYKVISKLTYDYENYGLFKKIPLVLLSIPLYLVINRLKLIISLYWSSTLTIKKTFARKTLITQKRLIGGRFKVLLSASGTNITLIYRKTEGIY